MQSALVKAILEKWKAYEWTVQGFGFIRTKIADIGRIHVWDSRLATPGVSTAHTHPWPFSSTIISGELINQRFTLSDQGVPYLESDIKTGEGGGLTGEPREVMIDSATTAQAFHSGWHYIQGPEEIHRSIAQDGTVTLLQRPQGPPLELAKTYWPRGTSWVSAEPRKAEEWEVRQAISYALARWHSAESPP